MLKYQALGLLVCISFLSYAQNHHEKIDSVTNTDSSLVKQSLIFNQSALQSYTEQLSLQINLSCYPNPTESMSNVLFTLSNQAHVKIDILNKNGLLVKELMNEEKQAGQYDYPVNFSTYKKGLYFIILHANNLQQSFPLFIY